MIAATDALRNADATSLCGSFKWAVANRTIARSDWFLTRTPILVISRSARPSMTSLSVMSS